jgi:hypothetical protein
MLVSERSYLAAATAAAELRRQPAIAMTPLVILAVEDRRDRRHLARSQLCIPS